MTPEQEIAFSDFFFNFGETKVCDSSPVRNFNAGNDVAACETFRLWDKVRINGRLEQNAWQVKRRAAESALCKE
jgi:GH24 family phage-related lysozyme (muramidase)